MKITALIMAGGVGERFWPRSRKSLPKQFLDLTGTGKTMIQLTIDRICSIVSPQDIYIATNINYRSLVMEQLPMIPKENILCEPCGRNTAPCIGLGSVVIASRFEDAVMMVLPSDHLVDSEEDFIKILSESCTAALEDSRLVTIGIRPDYPETGYGYIRMNTQRPGTNGSYKVERFVEKPDLELANEYIYEGCYLWNSGMFIWKVSSILAHYRMFLPDMYKGLMRIKDSIGLAEEQSVITDEFNRFESISVDYGIMEKAEDIYVFPGDFGWDDVGSWLAVGRLKEQDDSNNIVTGNTINIGSRDCIIEGSDKLIAAIGLNDVIVVDTDDALLICNKEHAGDIKKLIQELKNTHKEEYL